jgi:3-deoxy-D-manno-octulosonic-acid transferase
MKKFVLFFYNLLFLPLLLLLLPSYLLRMRRRGGYRAKAAQRFCFFDKDTLRRIGTGRLWIHAASVGETGIALKFIAEYHRQYPTARFLLSITTSTGLAIAEHQASEWLEVIANPVDFPILTSRLVRQFHPAALLFIEADLWPNRVEAAHRLGIPSILVNARLSTRSEKRFRMARAFTAPFFNTLRMIILTDPEDRQRWLSLGVEDRLLQLAGNIKHDTSPPSGSDPIILPEGLGWGIQDPVLLAASTHEGEELEIARAYLLARKSSPKLHLIIAPRHVERRNAIIENLRTLGLSCALRSSERMVPADVLLLDTTGELSRWYSLATVVFVGKSLSCAVNHGGQNMIEPLQAGRPVLIGPHTGNFEPLATRLCETGAAIRVDAAETLAAALGDLLLKPAQHSKRIDAAQRILSHHRGSAQRACSLVAGTL